MKFYDLKARKSFETSKFEEVTKIVNGKKRKFAVTTAPSGVKSYRII